MKKYLIFLCLFTCTNVLWAQKKINGTVTDSNQEPLIGATVIVKGNVSKGTITDLDGKFSLDGVKNGDVIQASFIGFASQEKTYTGQATLLFELLDDSQMLDEVVVTALGITRESKALGYAVSTIKSEDLIKVGAPNFATALYGKAPGVRIQQVQGGSIAGVSMTVRGLSSIDGNSQPLVIVNGVPIRNGGTGSGNEATFAEFGSEGRIRGNGLIDINPEDIESLSILKGAAATALYGSEAANGVVMITSKKASGTAGLTVDFNASLTANMVANVPALQGEYGPGRYTRQYGDYEKNTGGFYERSYQGKTYRSLSYGAAQWGPKYDGQSVLYWDGKERPYTLYSDQPWKELFRNGFNQNYNIAINSSNEKTNTRFSYTYNNEIPNALNANYDKHNFNMVGTMNFSKKLKLDYSVNYVVQNIHNRARNAMGMFGSFSDAYGSFVDLGLMKQMYKTSLGYRNQVYGGGKTLTPDEVFAFDFGEKQGLSNYFWNQYDQSQDQVSNRVISSIAPSWKLLDWLTLQGRMSNDLTADKEEFKSNSDNPLAFYDPSGGYNVVNRRYNIYYGDVMLMANKDLTDKLNLTVNLGWQGRSENMYNIRSWTDGGLANENWFSLNASRYQARTEHQSRDILKTAYVGTVGIGYDRFLYVDVTGRQEESSTLLKEVRRYFYPSFSGSFIFTELLKDARPVWYDYGKLRASYGIVGNAPEAYAANEVFEQGSNNGMTWNHVPGNMGNNEIRPEVMKEIEVGLESTFFKDRLGIEFSFYNRDITDLILNTPQASTSGVNNILLNVGGMKNTGYEFNLHGTPVLTKDFSWTAAVNFAFNRNKVTNLIEGVDRLENAGWAGGGAMLYSVVGRPMGDIYTQVYETDANGNYYVDDSGYYINKPDRELVANAQPEYTGGFTNQFTYKNFFLDALIDFQVGGHLFNEMYQYMTAQGLTPATLQYRSAESGGLAYYFEGDVNTSLAKPATAGATAGPNGEKIYHNGYIQPGIVKSTGQENQQIMPIDYLTYYTYNWGTDANQMTMSKAVFSKTYVKFRELALGYTLPKSVSSQFKCRNLQVSVFARNLFYLYKAMPDWDVESSIGTSWKNQAQIGGSTAPQRSFGFSLRASF
ncbi:MAG: SusC/RagA family TonB-linked outer membrane protein [Tannerella sp.]|jgi:TonB-linked SusC/RagA family outer membrane protein|nr:SusC/RagA family TonB-linked outer membrane protein [Tannerella sp.]